jgi:4-amino-4-deoxychorismate lyase
MCYDRESGFVRLPLHLARLARSAAAFGIPFDRDSVEGALVGSVKEAAGPLRVRLQLNEDGSLQTTAQPFVPPNGETVWTYRISPHRVQSADELLRHKTTWRELYDRERAQTKKEGFDETVFLNERGEIVEGCTTNFFLGRDGRLLTPASTCGPLDGCLRRALLESGKCIEAVLFPSDLEKNEVYLGNSLRGLVRAEGLTR